MANYNNAINFGLNTPINTQYYDSSNLDAFSRLRTSHPQSIFDAQMTYDLQPILFEAIKVNTGADVTHDATNRMALMTFAATPTGGKAFMQTYECFRYQPGRSHFIFCSFNFNGGVANCLKFAGYCDGTNGIQIQLNGTAWEIALLSGTTLGNSTIAQTNWNLDKLNGTGTSGLTLDSTKTQILVIDFQALYSGRVRVGFDIGGQIVYAHQFLNANVSLYPYIQSANLPIRVGMTCTGTVSTTMNYICSSVSSEGGLSNSPTYTFTTPNTAVTAANGVATYLMALQPRTTFNSIVNRGKISLISIDFSVTGANNVFWQLCIGQALTGTSYANVNTTYSIMNLDTAGTLSGTPAIILDSGYASSNKTATSAIPVARYPITLDAAGSVRNLGTLVLLVTGIGGNTAMSAAMTWTEER